MYGISRRAKRRLLKAYKAYFAMVMKQGEKTLTAEERKAVGQKVLEDLLDQSFKKLNIPEEDQQAFREEFEDLIRKKFPESLLDTPLRFTGEFTGKAFEDKRSTE